MRWMVVEGRVERVVRCERGGGDRVEVSGIRGIVEI